MFYGPDNLGAMGISVDIKIPHSVTEAAKIVPSLAKTFPQYAHEFQKETQRVTGVADAVNITVQTLGVALIFGGVIVALLLREKKK